MYETNNKNLVALLVHTCDRYEFLYKGFELFFAQYWDNSIKTNKYFATEELKINIDNFQNIQSGKGEWSDRLATLLKNSIKEDYILYVQEDMWFSKPINASFFNGLIDYVVTNEIDYVKLHSSEVYSTTPTKIDFEGLVLTKINNKNSKYLMSHQVSIWKKSFLLSQLKTNENPWRNERRATKRLRKIDPAIYHIDYFAENGKPPINQNLDLSKRSEYFTVSVNGMLGEYASFFIDLLSKNKLDDAYLEKLKYHFSNQLTHDGKPKPRKEDIFQKIKKWFKNRFL